MWLQRTWSSYLRAAIISLIKSVDVYKTMRNSLFSPTPRRARLGDLHQPLHHQNPISASSVWGNEHRHDFVPLQRHEIVARDSNKTNGINNTMIYVIRRPQKLGVLEFSCVSHHISYSHSHNLLLSYLISHTHS